MNKRINALREQMILAKVDGAVYATGGNLQYLLEDTGFFWQRTPDTGSFSHSPADFFLNKPDCILYIPVEGEPLLALTPTRAETMKHLKIKQIVCTYVMLERVFEGVIKGKKIAVGASCNETLSKFVQAADPNIQLCDGEQMCLKLRQRKDADEIATMRKVAKLTDWVMGETVKQLKPGISSRQVELLLNKLGLENGAFDIPFTPTARFVNTGSPQSMSLDGYLPTEPLVEGSSIGFDFGFVMNGYCSDFGRSFYCGKAPERISDAYKALQEAQCTLLSQIKPGMKMDVCFKSLYSSLEKHGFAEFLRNYNGVGLMGHQIGIEVHENPWLSDTSTEVFEPGMIMCIEPKIWMPGECFMRVEDMVLITETGAESLTTFCREMYSL